MIRRVILSPVAGLMLVITAILGLGYSSAQAQAPGPGQPTPHLVFSTYLGGSVPFVSGASALTFAQNAACDAQGNTYVTGATTVSDLPGTTNAYQSSPARRTARCRRSWRNTTLPAICSGAPTWVATIKAWASGWPPCRTAA